MGKRKKTGQLHGLSDRTSDIILVVICLIIVFLVAYPLYYVLVASVSNPYDVYAGKTFLFPSGFTLDGYKAVFADKSIITGFLNSIKYTVVGTIFSVVMIYLSAYPLSVKNLPGRKFLSIFFIITMYFGGGMIPWYLMYANVLNLKGSTFPIWFPGLMSPFLIILMRTFISESVPDAITESAKLDGAGHVTIFFRIILPVLGPGLATVGLFLALGYWNDWYRSSMFSVSQDTWELQFYLYNLLNASSSMKQMAQSANIAMTDIPTQSMKLAMAVVVTGPVLLFYPFVQRYFVSGITVGAVKG